MIDRGHRLPVKRQAELLGISRGTVYYQPEAIPDAGLALMRHRPAAPGSPVRRQSHAAGSAAPAGR
jgi:hypothetical protein